VLSVSRIDTENISTKYQENISPRKKTQETQHQIKVERYRTLIPVKCGKRLLFNSPSIHNKLTLRINYFDITTLQMNKHNNSRRNPHIFQWKSFNFTKNRSNIKFIHFTWRRQTIGRHICHSLRSDVNSINLPIGGNPRVRSPVGPNILGNSLYCADYCSKSS